MAGWGPGGWMDGWKGAKQELPAAANYTLKRKKRKRAGPLWMDGWVDGWMGAGRMDGWMEGRQTGIAGGGQLHLEEEEEARRPPLD